MVKDVKNEFIGKIGPTVRKCGPWQKKTIIESMVNLNPLPLTWEANEGHGIEARGPDRLKDYLYGNVSGCREVRITIGPTDKMLNGTVLSKDL